MCRIALFNREGLQSFGQELPPLSDFLSFLELRKGGDGNGFAVLKENGEVVCEKGMPDKFNPQICAERLYEFQEEGNWFLFHTRKASEGLPAVENQVQPMLMGPYVLCMNGTEKDLLPMASQMNMSDTQLILIKTVMDKLSPISLLRYHSNFAGFYNGNPFLVKNRDVDMHLHYNKISNAIVFASEFPEEVRNFNVPDIFYWDNNEPVEQLIS
ncbi:hypothetical protein [Coprothermobacter platensis]|uniref:hypothetical protein n=1 Tax=Coprothermobacter platensis TaxID=108819 RepID=UPI000360504E|nr:hypothetical protein [Coprothermobacter platensis]